MNPHSFILVLGDANKTVKEFGTGAAESDKLS
jgi:hypothetical protein